MSATQKYLEQLCACREAREWVGDQTLEQAWQSCTRLDWLQWLVEAAAWAEYKRAAAQAYAEYERATAAARAEYDRAAAAAWADYDRATAPAYADYDRATAAAWACKTPDEVRAKFTCPEVPA